MSTIVNIPLAALESKKKQLEKRVAEINAEIGHIEWVIKNFKSEERTTTFKAVPLQYSIGSTPTVRELIEAILRDNKPSPMSVRDILREMIKRGRNMSLPNLFSHISTSLKKTGSKIVRLGPNQYSVKD